MPVEITINGISEEVRDELAARAASQRLTMQEFLLSELERIASRPSVEAWLGGVRQRTKANGTRVPTDSILQARDSDRT